MGGEKDKDGEKGRKGGVEEGGRRELEKGNGWGDDNGEKEK